MSILLRRPHSLLPFLLLSIYTSTSAFPVRYNERRLFRPLTLQLALFNDGDDDKASSQLSPVHHNKSKFNISFEGFMQHWQVRLLTMLAFTTMTLLPSPSAASVEQVYSPLNRDGVLSSSTVIATETLSSISPSSISELGLKPATEEKPQIMLPDRSPSQQTMPRRQTNAREPILQGLVYFPERAPTDPAIKSPAGPQVKQQLDYYSDILVLTAVSATHPEGPVLAGAKFPVSSVRFPFSFQMYKENLLTSRPGVQDAWDTLADTGDVVLRASICPSDASALPCASSETKKYAEGVAKIISNLPGLKEGEIIRAPASLALQ